MPGSGGSSPDRAPADADRSLALRRAWRRARHQSITRSELPALRMPCPTSGTGSPIVSRSSLRSTPHTTGLAWAGQGHDRRRLDRRGDPHGGRRRPGSRSAATTVVTGPPLGQQCIRRRRAKQPRQRLRLSWAAKRSNRSKRTPVTKRHPHSASEPRLAIRNQGMLLARGPRRGSQWRPHRSHRRHHGRRD